MCRYIYVCVYLQLFQICAHITIVIYTLAFLLVCNNLICRTKCIRGHLRVYCEVATYQIERERQAMIHHINLTIAKWTLNFSQIRDQSCCCVWSCMARKKKTKQWISGTMAPLQEVTLKKRINLRSFPSWDGNSLSGSPASDNKDGTAISQGRLPGPGNVWPGKWSSQRSQRLELLSPCLPDMLAATATGQSSCLEDHLDLDIFDSLIDNPNQ